jgi:dihydrodipicolinate synthase/N-acetylneuraminate lyase
MKKTPVSQEDLRGVFSVPPLARKADGGRKFDRLENDRIARHISAGGITRLVYGGNAFLYHITLAEYEELLEWLSGYAGDLWMIPSAGPSYGRALDQARLLRKYSFPCVMMLPCADPRDPAGLEQGLREVADAAAMPLILYFKDENSFGTDRSGGLDAVARLVDDGICVAIKYAIVRADPRIDPYLEGLLQHVDRSRVVSGIGERPAIAHMRQWKLPGFTTGSGCLAPALSNQLFDACRREDYESAETLRSEFLPLEDLRDSWGPARVLHAAAELADVARTGPVLPYLSPLSSDQLDKLAPVARSLVERNTRSMPAAAGRVE